MDTLSTSGDNTGSQKIKYYEKLYLEPTVTKYYATVAHLLLIFPFKLAVVPMERVAASPELSRLSVLRAWRVKERRKKEKQTNKKPEGYISDTSARRVYSHTACWCTSFPQSHTCTSSWSLPAEEIQYVKAIVRVFNFSLIPPTPPPESELETQNKLPYRQQHSNWIRSPGNCGLFYFLCFKSATEAEIL